MTRKKSNRVNVNFTPEKEDIYTQKYIKLLNNSITIVVACITKEMNAQTTQEYKSKLLNAVLINVLSRSTAFKIPKNDFLNGMESLYDCINNTEELEEFACDT